MAIATKNSDSDLVQHDNHILLSPGQSNLINSFRSAYQIANIRYAEVTDLNADSLCPALNIYIFLLCILMLSSIL